jgi:hypothetical protein
MATGDTTDIQTRLRLALPKQWFPSDGVVIGAILGALATSWAWFYTLYAYIKLQSRVLTASDGWLDMIAGDFFGTSITRKANQTDTSFRSTIIVNLFRERATRKAVTLILTQLTGRAPVIIEPQRPADCGAYSAPNSGYGSAGAYGSMLIPYQAFVKAFRPLTSGVPIIAGYGNAPAAYGVASQGGEYASMSMIIGTVQDADIYAAIDGVRPAASTLWTSINS